MTETYTDYPPGAFIVGWEHPKRCWECGRYSFKVFAGENDNSGKCFWPKGEEWSRDNGDKVYWVTGDMSCPKWIKDEDA